jgi:uncharacterized membrane protein (UPF0127 family)
MRVANRMPGLPLLLVVGLLLAAAAPAGEAKPDKPKAPPREEIVIAGEKFKLEVAASPPSRARGLMERTEIDEHGGMLFIYRDVRRRSFWMKNCLVDIDRGEDETEWAYEWRLRSYPSRRPAQFVIELEAGTIDRLKLERGQTIELDYSRLRKMAR